MDATPNNLTDVHQLGASTAAAKARFDRDTLNDTWMALHEAAAVAAAIAEVDVPAMSERVRSFASAVDATGDWRRSIIEQGIEDLSAVMQPGLSALLAAHRRGGQPQAAAASLWREFVTARDAMLALVPEPEVIPPVV